MNYNIKMKKNKYISAYLVVCGVFEDETYYFKNIDDMFKFCECTTIKQCLEYFSSLYSTATIYRINRSYSSWRKQV